MSLKQQLIDDMKAAMKSGAKDRLGVIRLINAGLKQREVDERIEITDSIVLAVMEKMLKQRKDSITQFEAAGREDLAAIERFEVTVISEYMPAQMSAEDLDAAIKAAIAESGASSAADMGKVMAILKPLIAGKADMGQASAKVKAMLAG